MDTWNSKQYLKFAKERTQPSVDLVNRISLIDPLDILDVGCGPGNSTATLYAKYPNAAILGIDHSKEMIEAARKAYPALSFALCDAGSELPLLKKQFDIVFSNACIQWIPHHEQLLQEMMQLIKPGGMLAIQTPMNDDEPIHQIIEEIIHSKVWKDKIQQPRIFFNLSQTAYYDILSTYAEEVTLWETTYFHVMKSHEAILEWYRGTGLRPYLAVLSAQDQIMFEKVIYDRLVTAYPKQKNGDILFRFPRFFMLASK